ncbi:MAG: MTH938/NDUFAF3 family protein [Wolbachia sp.]
MVNDQKCHGSIMIFHKKVFELKESDINSKEHFESLLTEEIEILLIDTDKTCSTLDSSVISYIVEQKDFSFKFMTTCPACRTRNILIFEDRFVVTYLRAM